MLINLLEKLLKLHGMCHVSLYSNVKSLRENLQPRFGYIPENRRLNEEQQLLLEKAEKELSKSDPYHLRYSELP